MRLIITIFLLGKKMSKRLLFVSAAIAILTSSGVLSNAQAADERFCEEYAQTAVHQFHDAEHHERCGGFLRDTSRWQPDFRAHFDWCRNVRREQAEEQRDARTRALDECAR